MPSERIIVVWFPLPIIAAELPPSLLMFWPLGIKREMPRPSSKLAVSTLYMCRVAAGSWTTGIWAVMLRPDEFAIVFWSLARELLISD